MARHNVLVVPMMRYYRSTPKSPFLGWGNWATRKVTTRAMSPRLLAYRACIAAQLGGKKFANLKEVQETFKRVAPECARQAASKPTIKHKKGIKTLFF